MAFQRIRVPRCRSSNGALWGPKRSLAARVEMALGVARGMAAMEAASPPLLHRDLKPANVFIGAHLFTDPDARQIRRS